MNNSGIRIKYGNFAPEAKENFNPFSDQSQFDTLDQLKEYNLPIRNYGNPCEGYQVALDGGAEAIPSDGMNLKIGMWSKNISNSEGTFVPNVVLELTSDGQYSSQGITLSFDQYNNVYATALNIKWYRGETLLSEKDFQPDAARYSCLNQVEYYNKVVITFFSLNMPHNRLRLSAIDYGYGTWFEAQNLRDVKITQSLNLISSEININTADFTIDNPLATDLMFQERQKLSIYHNGNLKAVTFAKKSKRKSKRLWALETEDYIGIMEDVIYYGGIYNNVKAVDLLDDIFSVAKVPYTIDDVFSDAVVSGFIPYTTCRAALMQVAFAIQAVVDTSNSENVKIFALSDDVAQKITLDRIMQGQNFSDEDTVAAVEITSHSYLPIGDSIEAYNAKESGISEIDENGDFKPIFVKFSEPLHDLNTNGNGEISKSDANYAIVYAYADDFVLTGQKYEHTKLIKRKDNPLVLASEVKKVVSVENATLVSANNVDIVLEKCYNYYASRGTINMKILEGKHIIRGDAYKYGEAVYGEINYGAKSENQIIYDTPVNVGDVLRVETEYLGELTGRVTEQTFSLNGGIIIKNCVLK